MLSSIRLRANRVPMLVRIPLTLIGLVLAVCAAVLQWPPYNAIMRGQLSVLSKNFYPGVAEILTAMTFVLPVAVIIHVIATFLPPTTEEQLNNGGIRGGGA